MSIKRFATALAGRILPQTPAAAGCAYEKWCRLYNLDKNCCARECWTNGDCTTSCSYPVNCSF